MDAITHMNSSNLQPDEQAWFSNALTPSAAIRQARTTQAKQQLTREMARKAKRAPETMVKVYMEAFAPICDIKDSFECSGRQPTKDEGHRNEAAFGYRTPTAFLNAVAAEIGEQHSSKCCFKVLKTSTAVLKHAALSSWLCMFSCQLMRHHRGCCMPWMRYRLVRAHSLGGTVLLC